MNDDNAGAPTKQRYDVFVVDNYTDKTDGSEAASWLRIGAAFPHKDSKGFSIELKALPTVGKLVIREHEPKPKQ